MFAMFYETRYIRNNLAVVISYYRVRMTDSYTVNLIIFTFKNRPEINSLLSLVNIYKY